MIRFIIQPIKTMVVAMKEAPWSNKSGMLNILLELISRLFQIV